jgi:hypothetical protein
MDSYILSTDTVALSTATAKTVAHIATPATGRIKLSYISIAMDGAASATPARVDLLRQTTAGTATSTTPNPIDPDAPASLTTCTKNCTSEPTASTILYSWYIPNGGQTFMINFAPGEEPLVQESGRIGIRINSPLACNSITNISFIE